MIKQLIVETIEWNVGYSNVCTNMSMSANVTEEDDSRALLLL